MRNMTKLLLFLLVLLLSLSIVSASGNVSGASDKTDMVKSDCVANEDLGESTSDDVSIHDKSITKNARVTDDNRTVKLVSRTITVTSSNYDQFFRQDSGDEFVKSTDLIQSGDTVNLKGNFRNKNFAVDKRITFTSLNHDAKLVNSTVYVLGRNASSSIIANLDISNDGTLLKGIQVKNSSKLLIENNTIKTLGLRAYGFVADYMTYSTVRNNYFEREGDDWRYITFVIGKSHYNNINNNTILCGGANGIYLSIYGSVDANFDGGPCNYNNITHNKITAHGYITSWCYTIQVMGANNRVSYNTVKGGFRGISTQDYENNVITYNDVHAINEGIFACEKATVAYNNIHVNESAYGITIGSDNVIVKHNNITSTDSQAIEIRGSNALIANNTISSENASAIHSKGTYTNIVIDNNKITSKLDGILFRQQSRTKKINHVLVTRNTIVSEGDYAINFEEAGSQYDAEVNITVSSSNVLTSARGTGDAAYLKPANLNSVSGSDTNQVITVTDSNYSDYFADDTANTKIKQNATVYLSGTFNNHSFIFNRKVHIIGKNSQINNGTITLTGDAHASTISNINIKNDAGTSTTHAIELLEVNNCRISKVKIDNYAEYESLGIFIYGANGNQITNNTIKTSGDYVNNGILAYSSDSNRITANNIRLNQSDKKVQYADSIMFNERIGTIQEVLHNHGIILLYSSNNIIDGNNVNATSMFKKYTFPNATCRNSMVGIDIYFESHNNRVTNNRVSVIGYGPYNYGIGVLGGQWGTSILSSNATNNLYEANNVTVRGGYFATGFIAGRNSVKTTVKENIFNINLLKNSTSKGDYAHAITLENSTNSMITGNTLTSTASSVYSIELFDSSSNNIILNNIKATGTYPYGIAATRSSNNKIQNNTINIKEANLGPTSQATHSESIESGNDAILFTGESKNNQIRYNAIKTNAETTVKLTSQTANNKVNENSLIASAKVGDNSVNNKGKSNNVSGNFVYFVNTTLNPVNAMIGDTITITAKIITTGTDYTNLTATYLLGTTNIGKSRVVNGKSTLKFNVSTIYRPTTYQLTVKVAGNNYQNSTAKASATFTKEAESIKVKVAKVCQIIGSTAKLQANITTQDGGKIGSGQAEFYLDNKKLSRVNVTLGSATYNYRIPATSKSGLHTIKVVYLGTSDYKRAYATNTLGIQSKTVISVLNHTAKLGNKATIRATVKSGNATVNNVKAKIYIGLNYIATATISNGKISYNYTVPSKFNKTTYTLKIVYNGNNTLSSATGYAKIKINPYTSVFSYTASNAKVGQQSSIVLRITNGQNGSKLYKATSGNVTIKLNGKILKDSNGKVISGIPRNGTITFKFTAPQQLVGKQNITFTYAGNNKFSKLTKTYKNGLIILKNDLNITLNKIGDVKYGDNITVTGKFTDTNGKLLKNTYLNVKINNKTFNVKTNQNAQYRLVTRTSKMGINTVTVSYAGNAKYNAKSIKTTFKVLKQDLKITIDKISTIGYASKVNIKGKLVDANKNRITNTNLKIILNNQTYNLKTDNYGQYTLTTNNTKKGTNIVNVMFTGNKYYNKYVSPIKTFNMV
ncbi:MAG: hypothetical protein BZ138_08230 [Methanosphaera sp. rholeuAM270]|nr:MAG: hypothetical protein BZ138_08230 [Methanosphaera sp. rholeuAM270]